METEEEALGPATMAAESRNTVVKGASMKQATPRRRSSAVDGATTEAGVMPPESAREKATCDARGYGAELQ